MIHETQSIPIGEIFNVIYLAKAANLPLLVIGPHGIGKSTIFESAAGALQIDIRVLDLSLLEPVDLIGIPTIVNGHTTYAPPSVLPQEGHGLLLLEELNRASPQTRTPALELLTRRQLHEYSLPPGWLPCASINPDGNDYDVDALDPALMSRFCSVRVEADHAHWLAWARQSNVHPAIVSYVEASPGLFEDSDVTPRSVEYASDVLWRFEESYAPNPSLLLTMWTGLVGPTIAIAMMRFLNANEKPATATEILTSYPSIRPTVVRAVQQSRLDTIIPTLKKLKRHLEREETWQAVQREPSKQANLEQFLADIPPDLRSDFSTWQADRGYLS